MPRTKSSIADVSLIAPAVIASPDILMRIAQGLLVSGRGMAVFAPDDRIHFASEGFVALYDMPPGPQTFDSLMRHCWSTGRGPRITTDSIDTWLAAAHAKRRSQPVREFEVDMVDGRWLWISEATLPDGWVVLSVADITSVKRREFRLATDRDAALTAAETDHLTGLLNRGAMMKRFNLLVDRAITSNEVFCAVLIDLDHFKSINDRFGHDAGDQVLIHFATSATAALRKRDMMGRVGGEEFLILTPGANLPKTCTIVERLQAHVRDQRISLNGVTLRYTFSAGVAQWHRGMTVDQLYREADQALYAAKDAGRNLIGRAG